MRPMGKEKMGYYPTPISVVERIKTFLDSPKERVSILDPCAGCGSAVKALLEGQEAETFGIELDGHRVELARRNVNHVLHASFDQVRITNGAFSCLFLNPPYDDETVEDGNTERKEKVFLKGTVKYLQQGGLLIYIIPQRRLDKTIAKILSYRFEHFQVYRFPEGEFETFRQVVIFAKRKQRNSLDEETLLRLATVRDTELEGLPFLEAPVYELLPSKPITLFRPAVISEEELAMAVKDSPLWKRFQELVRVDDSGLKRPPLLLHTGHLSLLLASGMLDGVVGEGDERHVVTGKVEKITNTWEEMEGDVLVERTTEHYKVSIKVLRQDGEIMTLT